MADDNSKQASSSSDISQKDTDKPEEVSEGLLELLLLEDGFTFAALASDYYSEIEEYIRNFVEYEELEDIVLETFNEAYNNLKYLPPGTNLRAWFHRIADNVVNDHIRRRKKHQSSIDNAARIIIQDTSILHLQILEEPFTAQNLSTIITAITDLYTRCWLIQQERLADLIDYAQTHDPRFVKDANLQVGRMIHNSPAIIDLLLNAGTIAGGAATLVLVLTKAIDAIAQTPLRFEATKLKNQRETQTQLIQAKQAELEQQITAQKAETEDKGKQLEQQLDAERKLLELERQRMLLDIEKQKLEVEAEKQRTALDRERLEFEKNRIIIVQEIAVTMVGQLLSSEDRADAGRTEMLVHSLIPSLLQLSAIDAVVTTLPTEQPNEESK